MSESGGISICFTLCLLLELIIKLCAKESLLFVYVLFRHGDRAPITVYPTSAHQHAAWPNGYGEITELGMRQQFHLGRSFFFRYTNQTALLSRNFDHREVYIRSTDVNRTLISAMASTAGMFPHGTAGKDFPDPRDEPEWPLWWTPVPVHSSEIKFDYVGNPFRRCPRGLELEVSAYKSAAYNSLRKENEELLEMLSNVTGTQMAADYRIFFLYDTLNIERIHNLSRPAWCTEEIFSRIKSLRRKLLEYRYGNSDVYGDSIELTRLRGGPILGSIVNILLSKWKCDDWTISNPAPVCRWLEKLKFYAFSVHDVTLSCLFTSLECEKLLYYLYGDPDYGSNISFELYDIDGYAYIKILYAPNYQSEPHVITNLIPGCPVTSDYCFIDQFVRARRRFIPKNIRHECAPRKFGSHGSTARGKRDVSDGYDDETDVVHDLFDGYPFNAQDNTL